MSKFFIHVARGQMRLIQASPNLHVNLTNAMVSRKYTTDPNFELTNDIMATGSDKHHKRKQRYNPKPKVPKAPKIKQLGKQANLHTPKGPIPYTSYVDNEDVAAQFLSKLSNTREKSLQDCFVLEGKILIAEAIKAGCVPHTILFSRSQDILELPLPKDVTLYRVRYRTLQLWSSVTTSPGIMGVFQKPNLENIQPSPGALPLTIICVNIREPGNLGSILRNAATVGCQKVLLTKGCVDLWSSKVVRAAAGAHFVIPIFANIVLRDIKPLIESDTNIYIADNITTFNQNPTSNLPRNMKNFGPTEDDSTCADTDDKSGTVKSWNKEAVDGHVCNTVNSVDGEANDNTSLVSDIEEVDDEDEDCSDNETITSTKQKNKSAIKTQKQKNFMLRQVLELKARIPVVPYYCADFTDKHNTLVIDGETEGITMELLSYFAKNNAVRINIPMSNGFDSLNTSTATGILAFEIKRQLLSEQNSV